jgi:hypothetical protein
MLSESGINPFESQETKPYKDDPRIMVMMQLVEAFQKSDIDEFNKLVRNHEGEIMSDKFIRIFLDDLVFSIRSQGIINIVKSYTRISLEHLSSTLAIDIDSVERIIMKLILDKRLTNAKINMIDGLLEVNYAPNASSEVEETALSSILPARYRDSELDQKRQQEQQTIVSGEATDQAQRAIHRSDALTGWLEAASNLHVALNASAKGD